MIRHSCTLALGGQRLKLTPSEVYALRNLAMANILPDWRRRWRGVLASLSRKGLTRIDEDRFYVLTQKGLEATQKIRQFYAESS